MEKLDIIDIVDAKTIGESEFPKEFLVEKICDQAIFDCVIAEHNSTRQGTHSTLTKAEVRGGGIKPRPQKHSGRARQGSIRNPQWVGGGVVFGPKPGRNYKNEINRKVNALALKSAISVKIENKNVGFVDFSKLDTPSAKTISKFLKSSSKNKVLFVLGNGNEKSKLIMQSVSNIPTAHAKLWTSTSVKDILNAGYIFFDKNFNTKKEIKA